MIFSLVITGAPHSSNAPYSALRFARSALENGHGIHRIFLQGDGVLCATNLGQAPQDLLDVPALWQEFAAKHNIDVVVCVTSALKRGILNESEARRYGKGHFNLAGGMEISGLGQLMDAIQQSDRVVTFGA